MNTDSMEKMVAEALPGCRVQVIDLTGTGDHFRVEVIAPQFDGKNLVEQHQMVNAVFRDGLADGSIHALSIKTAAPGKA
jgi:stress-induced morphogen